MCVCDRRSRLSASARDTMTFVFSIKWRSARPPPQSTCRALRTSNTRVDRGGLLKSTRHRSGKKRRRQQREREARLNYAELIELWSFRCIITATRLFRSVSIDLNLSKSSHRDASILPSFGPSSCVLGKRVQKDEQTCDGHHPEKRSELDKNNQKKKKAIENERTEQTCKKDTCLVSRALLQLYSDVSKFLAVGSAS